MSLRQTGVEDFINSGGLNELAKQQYKKTFMKQADYINDLIDVIPREAQEPSQLGLTYSIQISGVVGASGSLEIADRHAGSIGRYAGFTAKTNKVYISGSFTRSSLVYASNNKMSFLVHTVKKRLAETKMSKMQKLNRMLYSIEGEIGKLKETSGVSVTDQTITFTDVSSAIKVQDLDLPLEVWDEDASPAPSAKKSTLRVSSVADSGSSNDVIKVRKVSVSNAGAVTLSDFASGDVASGDTIWGEGDRTHFKGNFYGLYFWSPDKTARATDVLGGKLKRSSNPRHLSGLYHETDLDTDNMTIYKAFSQMGLDIEQYQVEVDTIIMNPAVKSVLDNEEHDKDRYKKSESITIGDRQVPAIRLNSRLLRVMYSPLIDIEKCIAFNSKDTFKILSNGELCRLDNLDGNTLERGKDYVANEMVYNYRLFSYFNFVCEKPKNLAQIRLKNIANQL